MIQTSIFVSSIILFNIGIATLIVKNEDLVYNSKAIVGVILVFLAYLLIMILLLNNTTPRNTVCRMKYFELIISILAVMGSGLAVYYTKDYTVGIYILLLVIWFNLRD